MLFQVGYGGPGSQHFPEMHRFLPGANGCCIADALLSLELCLGNH